MFFLAFDFLSVLCGHSFFSSSRYVSTCSSKGCWVKVQTRMALFVLSGFVLFLVFDFCRFCVIIRICMPATTANALRLRRIFYPRFYPLHFCPILILQKEPVFPFSMFGAKQENYWYHFCNVFGMMRSLTGDWTRDLPHSKPALLPLGYRGGGINIVIKAESN